jgi:protein-tyrosine phosphatase
MAVADVTAPVVQDQKSGETPAPTVLFVCTGNTCRSPMAAALFNDLAMKKGIATRAVSAGLYPAVGAPISPETVEVLREAGIAPTPENDYPAHTARGVSDELMREAAVVYAITASHAMGLLMQYPQYAAKITTLPMDIDDPYGRGMEAYRTCFGQLQCAMAVLLADGGEERA